MVRTRFRLDLAVLLSIMCTYVCAFGQEGPFLTIRPVVQATVIGGNVHGFVVESDTLSNHSKQHRATLRVRIPEISQSVLVSEKRVCRESMRIERITKDGILHEPSRVKVYGNVSSGESILVLENNNRQKIVFADARHHVLYQTDENGGCRRWELPSGGNAMFACGSDESAIPAAIQRAIQEVDEKAEQLQADDTLGMLTIDVAVEMDNELFRYLGSDITDAEEYLVELFARVSAIYERDLSVRLQLSHVRIWETSDDPYDNAMGVFDLVEPFARLYEERMDSISRNIAVLLIRRQGQGGIARSIGGICQTGLSYCAADVSNQMGDGLEITDHALVAHEIGHLCGGVHTQNCTWPGGPLDSCVVSEGGSCVTSDMTRQRNGTIMSYCSLRTNPTPEFHPFHKRILRRYLRDAECIGNSAQKGSAILTGIVTSASDGQPVNGLQLLIRPFNDEIVVGTPPSTGDTVVTTDAFGKYEFKGLALGVYSISPLGNYVITPLDNLASNQGMPCILPADTTVVNFSVIEGRTMQFTFDSATKSKDVVLAIHPKAANGRPITMRVATTEVLAGDTVSRTLPYGEYVVVPMGIGQSFSPPSQVLKIGTNGVQPQLVRFICRSIDDSAFTVAVFTKKRDSENSVMLSSNEEVEILNLFGNATSRITTDSNGAGVGEMMLSSMYLVSGQWDTTQWVEDQRPDILTGSEGPRAISLGKRLRSFPLWASQLKYSSQQGTYTPLAEGAKNVNVLTAGNSVRVTLPFAFPTATGSTSDVWIGGAGVLSIGNELPIDLSAALLSREVAAGIVSAFGGAAVPDSGLQNFAVTYGEQGESPNRVVTFQWQDISGVFFDFTNVRMSNVGRLDGQIRLHENGTVEIVYGPMEQFEGKSIDLIVGLRGRDVLDASAIVVQQGQNWLNTRPFTSGFQTMQTAATINNSISETSAPPSGTTLVWQPQTVSVVEGNAVDHGPVISPLPANGQLNIAGLITGETTEVALYDMAGMTVLTKSVRGANATLDVSALSPGVYFVVTTLGSTSWQTIAIIGSR